MKAKRRHRRAASRSSRRTRPSSRRRRTSRPATIDALRRHDDGRNANVGHRERRHARHRRPGRRRPDRRRPRTDERRCRSLPFQRSERDRVVAGVCGGVADALGVDATLVRLVFALLALAGGAGILLYFALWVWTGGRRAGLAVLHRSRSRRWRCCTRSALSRAVVFGAGLLVAGVVLLARRGATLRPGGSLFVPGDRARDGRRGRHARPRRLVAARSSAPGAVAGALLLVLGPWVWQLAARARPSGSALAGARGGGGARSTTPCCRRSRSSSAHADDAAARRRARPAAGARAAPLALRQRLRRARRRSRTRSPRRSPTSRSCTASGSSSRARATRRSTSRSAQLVLAAREAMANAAKHSGADEISVYVEVGPASGRGLRPRPRRRVRPRGRRRRPPRDRRVDRGRGCSAPAERATITSAPAREPRSS